uniref:EB domain-containing protein n=1 Tax=Globodera pallida TaxID=36090 RepID=A0A183BPI3_GLOPA
MTSFCQKRQCQSLRIFVLLQLLFTFFFAKNSAQFSPCNGKALLNEPCDRDADCELKGSICLRQMCQCHPYYQITRPEKGAAGGGGGGGGGNAGGAQQRCVRLPAKIGEECVAKCREPLFCRGGRCQCVQRGSTQIVNGECVSTSRVGDRCSRHYDCTAPFSACVNHQCVCIAGTLQQGTKCVATTNCPMGGSPSGECIRRAPTAQIVNFVDEPDTCPHGHFCVGTPDSPVGHCCPALCPLGSEVDYAFACVPGGGGGAHSTSAVGDLPPIQPAKAPPPIFGRDPPSSQPPPILLPLSNLSNRLLAPFLPKKVCPSETHFCHFLAGDTFAQAVCCKRPCNSMAPESLYLNGECVARGQLASECKFHEQCGAAEGMNCVKGQCQCIDGFSPASDVITHPSKNPSQQCVRDCDKTTSLSRDTSCLGKVQLGGACFVQEQCPEHSGCYRGRCLCRCGYRTHSAQNKCVPMPAPSTQKPPPNVQIVPSIAGNADLFGIFNQFLGGAAGGQMHSVG